MQEDYFEDTPSLKSLLISFLQGKKMTYSPIELTIFSTSPLQAVDDELNLIELSDLYEGVLRKLNFADLATKSFKIILKEWKFVLRRIPNTTDFFYDIIAEDYEVCEDFDELDDMYRPFKLGNDPQVISEFELRTKAIIKKEYKRRKREKRKNRQRLHRSRSRSNSKRKRKEKVLVSGAPVRSMRKGSQLSRSLSKKSISVDSNPKRRRRSKKQRDVEMARRVRRVKNKVLDLDEVASVSSRSVLSRYDGRSRYGDDARSVSSAASYKSFTSYRSLASHISKFSKESAESTFSQASIASSVRSYKRSKSYIRNTNELIDVKKRELRKLRRDFKTDFTKEDERNSSIFKSKSKRSTDYKERPKRYHKASDVGQRGYFQNLRDEEDKENIKTMELRSGKKLAKVNLNYAYLKEKVRNKEMDWSQIEFTKAHLEYLKKNQNLLVDPLED